MLAAPAASALLICVIVKQYLTERCELAAANEVKLEEINSELNSKMAEMIDDFDRDKKAALDRSGRLHVDTHPVSRNNNHKNHVRRKALGACFLAVSDARSKIYKSDGRTKCQLIKLNA